MLKKILIVFYFGLIILSQKMVLAQSECREIIGYFPNWQWYDRAKLVNPSTIQYAKYDILNYCFFKPESDGSISSTDSWADENLLKGQINWSTTPQSYYPNTSIVDLCHNSGKKIMVSIGGWTLSDNFSSIAASSFKRALFAHNCNELIREYNFDGIDIDWEYPGYDHGGTIADKQNFTILMQQVKDSLITLGSLNNKTYLLSACFTANPAKMDAVEWGNLIPIIDCFNIMTYDYFGAWDAMANHNAPLHISGPGNTDFSIESTLLELTNHYNVPANKINIGIAFYGRSQMGANALFEPTNGMANQSIFIDDQGTPLYYNIIKNSDLFIEHYDDTAESPYLFGEENTIAQGTFVSYDNEQSVEAKATYIKNMDARGVIIWEITGDYMETSPGSGIIGSTPLIDKINEVFCASNEPNSLADLSNESNFINVYPNPSEDGVFMLESIVSTKEIYTIQIFNQFGSCLQTFEYDSSSKVELFIENSGIYYILVNGENTHLNLRIIKI